MDAIFFLRSYGDFIVALHALRNKHDKLPLYIYASRHLQHLYESLPPGSVPEEIKISFIELGIRHGLLACFTNRFLFTAGGIKELFALRKYARHLQKTEPFNIAYLEQSRRKAIPRLFTGIDFQPVHTSGNIYRSYQSFFNSPVTVASDFSLVNHSKPSIIIFPDSRKAEKTLPVALVNQVKEYCGGRYTLTIAQFKGKEQQPGDGDAVNGSKEITTHVVYKDFAGLVALVRSVDIIISADSLPLHLAQFFDKPHWVFYNNKINTEWITPYADSQGAYACFHEFDKLRSFLTRDSI